MIRSLAFTVALWGTARVAALPCLALRITRRIAPPDLRHTCDLAARDVDLIDLCEQGIALQGQVEAA